MVQTVFCKSHLYWWEFSTIAAAYAIQNSASNFRSTVTAGGQGQNGKKSLPNTSKHDKQCESNPVQKRSGANQEWVA